MLNLIIELSMYLFLVLMIYFVYLDLNVRYYSDEEYTYKITSKKQRFIIFTTHFLGFLLLYMQTMTIELLHLYGQQVIFFMTFFFVYNRFYKEASKVLINNMMYLLAISFIILTRLSYSTGLKQFRWTIISVVITLAIPFLIKYFKAIMDFKWLYAIMGFLLLITVFFYGQEIYGARNWIIIGDFSFQPSELVRVVFIFFIASLFKNEQSFNNVIYSSLVTLMYISVLIIKRDLGMALIFFVIYMVMLYIATSKWIYFFGGLLSASIAARVAYGVFYHVRVRVEAWQNPWNDISVKGYQIAQSLFAIGTGGWFGLGLGKGMPGKIPVVETDFIYAAIAEEWGTFFALGLLVIMLYIFIMGFQISKASHHFFYSLVAVGISSAYAFQVFLIIGGVTKLIPLTGVTLPFVSYGGSSLFSSFLMLAVLQGIYLINRQEQYKKSQGGEYNAQEKPKKAEKH